jgi:nuclear polyadenylated RNA-binding protein 3
MTSDAPEFYTKPTTPLSPLPFHPPEPSNIPVLRNQIDPIFNMTSTHLNTSDVDMTQAADDASNRSISNDSSEDNDDSGFSDTFDKDDRRADDAAKDTTAQQDAEVDDDFAKTFDSDGEGSSSKQDEIATTHVEQIQCPPAPLSSAADHTAHAAPVSSSSHVLSGGAEPTAFHDALPHTTAGDASVATYSIAAPVATETQQPQTLPLSYEAVSNGEIDIQQLLDNITANAALNAPSATNAPQTPPTFSNANLSQGTAGLPAHASLPPRPQVTQNPATAQGYTAHDDMRKYHAGPPGFQPPPNSTYRPLGAPPAISAAGAPGTASDPLNALPPPPLASFHPPAGAGPIPPPPFGFVPFAEGNRLPSKEPPASASAASQSDDDHSWNPAVKKLYDEFLADERMYVSEGLWDRFPVGSRLFIGLSKPPHARGCN